MTALTKEALVEAILEVRKRRLCMDRSCTTGCVGIFRLLIKSALLCTPIPTTSWRFLEPPQRIELRRIVEELQDFLTYHERLLLIDFCLELDPSIPAEALEIKRRDDVRMIEDARRLKEWREKVAERRLKKKQAKADLHQLRIQKKKDRDDLYWISYWAARHALSDVKKKEMSRKSRHLPATTRRSTVGRLFRLLLARIF